MKQSSTIERLLQENGKNYIFPFLWMHGETEEVIRKYMQVIYDSNIRAVCVESRPHPDFAGPIWWHDMDIILDEARKRDMKVWILDDSHFPTGYCNGALMDASADLCRQFLTCQLIGCMEQGEELEIYLKDYASAPEWTANDAEREIYGIRTFEDDRILAVLAVKKDGKSIEDVLDLTDLAEDGEIHFCIPEGTWKIYICHLTRNRGPHRIYMNMLSQKSCAKLLEAVYEPHYEHYAADFGKTIMGFFSDEPEFGNDHLYEYGKRIYELSDQVWSQEVQEKLETQWENDFRKYLPLLWEQEFAEEVKAKARFNYMDTITATVSAYFSGQIGDWCSTHGVEYIGHLIEDNNQHTRTGSSLGHFYRALIGQDMAGIDNIGGQILIHGEWNNEARNGEFYHFVLGKLADSMAAIEARKKGRAMCEVFGAYGWQEGVHLEMYQADHLLVRGINHYVPHGFSPKAFPDPDCPPHFYAHGHNPLYRHFGVLMKYMNRVCEIMSDGKAEVSAAILYNGESEWCGDCMMLEKPARILAENQVEYHFVPADIFTKTEYYKTETEPCLCVNGHAYEVLFIPYMQFIPEVVVKYIETLNQAGFPVIFIGGFPDGTCEGTLLSRASWDNDKLLSLEEMEAYVQKNIKRTIQLNPAERFIRYRHYEKDTDYYMFVNEGAEAYVGTILVPTKGNCCIYNAWDNRRERIRYEENENGTLLYVKLEPLHSLIVVFEEIINSEELPLPIHMQQWDKIQKWNEGWKRSICRSIDYPVFGKEKIITLPDTLAEDEPKFSGFVRYENTYCCEKIPEQMVLKITDAHEGVEVFINEKSLGIQVVFPYRYEIGSYLRKGENTVRIEAATTLEREMTDNPGIYLKAEEKTSLDLTGITGDIYILER